MILSMHTAGQKRLSEWENFPALYPTNTESAKLLVSLGNTTVHVFGSARYVAIFAIDSYAVL